MLTGIVNQESLPQLLQSIAQRRKQGDLEITLADAVVKISFIQGKIVEYLDGGLNPAQEVFAILKGAGLIKPEAPQFAGLTYSELSKHLEEGFAGGSSPTEALKGAIRKRLLNKLHLFEIESTVPWGFRVGGVDVERALAVGISVSQLLLDWSEVDATQEQFEQRCKPDSILKKVKSESAGAEQELVLGQLREPLTVAALEERCLLDALAFRQALLRLLESGSVAEEVSAPAPVPAHPEEKPAESPADAAVAAEKPAKPVRPRKVKKPKVKRESASDSLPHLIALVILIAAIILPFFFWQEAFTRF